MPTSPEVQPLWAAYLDDLWINGLGLDQIVSWMKVGRLRASDRVRSPDGLEMGVDALPAYVRSIRAKVGTEQVLVPPPLPIRRQGFVPSEDEAVAARPAKVKANLDHKNYEYKFDISRFENPGIRKAGQLSRHINQCLQEAISVSHPGEVAAKVGEVLDLLTYYGLVRRGRVYRNRKSASSGESYTVDYYTGHSRNRSNSWDWVEGSANPGKLRDAYASATELNACWHSLSANARSQAMLTIRAVLEPESDIDLTRWINATSPEFRRRTLSRKLLRTFLVVIPLFPLCLLLDMVFGQGAIEALCKFPGEAKDL